MLLTRAPLIFAREAFLTDRFLEDLWFAIFTKSVAKKFSVDDGEVVRSYTPPVKRKIAP